MSWEVLIAFWSVSLLFIIIPGVDWAYTISAGINHKMVIPAVIGLLTGHFIIVLIVALGVGTVVANNQIMLTILTLLGACYLIWVGINLVMSPPSLHQTNTLNTTNSKYWMIKGICISGLNPKVFLLFLTLLPQFIDQSLLLPISLQILVLGLIHIFSCAIIYLLVGLCAQKILQTRPVAAQIVSYISGTLMIIIGLCLLVEKLFFIP